MNIKDTFRTYPLKINKYMFSLMYYNLKIRLIKGNISHWLDNFSNNLRKNLKIKKSSVFYYSCSTYQKIIKLKIANILFFFTN